MLKKLRKNKKGFTLAELLIVVAIIGVLVAVSIPIFTAQLNKAKDATNMANARSIYAQLTADYLDNGKIDAVPTGDTSWNGQADGKVTIDGNEFKFTKLAGASLSIENAAANSTAAPKVTYTHGTGLGYTSADVFGQAASTTGTGTGTGTGTETGTETGH